jgi:hypothetical protein
MNRIFHLAIFLSLVVMACKSNSVDDQNFAGEKMIPVTMMEEIAPPPPPASYRSRVEKDSEPMGEQKLIKTSYLTVEVANYDLARVQVDSIISLHKAWISVENMNNYNHRISNNLAIRVPSQSFENLTNSLLSIAKKINSHSVESVDVTEEFIDIESRLKNQRAVEKKFTDLLRRTDSIEQILMIESKLAEVRGQIESIEGRLKYLSNRVSYSTINLEIYQTIDFKFVPEPMESFWERLKNSIHKGWTGCIAFLLFLIRLWPLWLVGIVLWFLYFRYRRRRLSREPKKKVKSKSKDKSLKKASKPEDIL